MRIAVLVCLLASLTGCYKMVFGPASDERLKKTNGNAWGVPVIKPVVWGFTGIPRDCTDCPTKK